MAYKIKGDVEVARGLGLGQLTTAERTAFVPSFAGYKVWDTDLNQEFTWDGATWTAPSNTSTIIDASAAPVALTLPAATGTGNIVQWVLDDRTNSASVAPTAGESLNGVVDGAFLFSNYEVGTQFRATDHGVGNWVVGVVGANSSSAYQTQVETLTYAANAVESVSFTHDGVQGTSGAATTFVGDIKIVRKYIGNGQAAVKIYGHVSYLVWDGVRTITLPTGTLTTPFLTNKRALRPVLNATAYVDLVVGVDTIAIDRDDNISGDSPCYFEVEGIGNWIGNRPDATLLAGMVEAKEIDKLYIQTTGGGNTQVEDGGYSIATSNTAVWRKIGESATSLVDSERVRWVPSDVKIQDGTGFTAGTNEVISNYTGRVRVSAQVIGGATNNNTNGDTWMLYLVKGGTAGNIVAHAQGHSSSALYGASTTTIEHELDVVAGEVLDLRMEATASAFHVDGSSFKIEMVPISTVVMPSALAVENASIIEIYPRTQVDNSGSPVINITWANIIANYESIQIEQSSSSGLVSASMFVETSKLVGGSFRLMSSSPSGINFSGVSGGSGFTATSGTGSGLTNAYLRITARPNQKTVINTNDTPVSDQASSGYFDIGDMRMQWGVFNTNSNGPTTLVFPQPFRTGTVPNIVAVKQFNTTTELNAGITAGVNDFPTATTASLYLRLDGNGTWQAGKVSWQAIGLKP